ncbi:MAG: hypothetical protein FWE14_08780 [Lachnospiraceae bacterium]|nr:hypothetical protein [Lachnospiraceae bacterium]
MRILQKSDQEIYDLIVLGSKMNIGERVFRTLCNTKNLDKNSSDYWFFRALLLSENMQRIESETKIFDCFEELLESCDMALEIEQEHWPVLYLRSLFSFLIQEFLKDEDETLQYMSPCYRSYEEQLSQIDSMFKSQQENSSPEFFITYCLLALINLNKSKDDTAIDCLKKGLEKISPGKIVYLSSIFKLPANKLISYKKIQINDIHKQLRLRLKEMSLIA